MGTSGFNSPTPPPSLSDFTLSLKVKKKVTLECLFLFVTYEVHIHTEKKEKIDLVKEDVQQLEQDVPEDQKVQGVQKLPNFLTRLIKTYLKFTLMV